MVSRRPRVLLTGFGAFPGVPTNVSSELVPLLVGQAVNQFPGYEFKWDVLPVTWQGGPSRGAELIEEIDPEVIVHFGVSEDASGFVIETLASNSCLATPDAGGAMPKLQVLEENAPSGLPVTLPCELILARLREAGVPATRSEDAGAYLCNAVLFQTLRQAREGVRAGFVHIPVRLDGGDGALSMEHAIRGGLVLLAACLDTESLS